MSGFSEQKITIESLVSKFEGEVVFNVLSFKSVVDPSKVNGILPKSFIPFNTLF